MYGARVKNLYKVVKKVAYKGAESLPPWPPVTFKMSGKTYYFPFRLYLKQERIFDEPMIRREFAYVAENLLLRGGYRKTHFQGDLLTFYSVSNMGDAFHGECKSLGLNAEIFTPKIVFKKDKQNIPEKFYFHELILQALIRKKIQNTIMNSILDYFNLNNKPEDFEILSEKALPEGFVDIFIKLKHPQASNIYFLVEIKRGVAKKNDISQLRGYISEIGDECKGGILIAKEFPRGFLRDMPNNMLAVRYSFEDIDLDEEYTYEELLNMLNLEVINRNGRN